MVKPKHKEFRSSLETLVSFLLQGSKLDAKFEDTVIPFLQPQQKRKYNPDFRLPKGILFADSPEVFIEVKGQLTSADRKKMKLVTEQHPDKIIVLLFGRSANRLNKKSNTTYADWADQYGIPWLDIKDIEHEGDIKRCLCTLMKKHRSGRLLNLRKRKSKALSQLERELSSTG